MVALLAILAGFIWASTNHIDKYLISKVTKNGDYKGLLVFSSFVSGLLLLPVFLFFTNFNIEINLISLLYIFLAVITSTIAIVFYYLAIEKNDTSLVIAIFQIIPVFVYILGFIFLNEKLTVNQVVGGIIILFSSIFITFNFEKLTFSKEKKKALFLMLGSSILYAAEHVLFKLALLKTDFNVVNVWFNIILVVVGGMLLILKNFRTSFLNLVKTNGKKVFGLNLFNEVWYQIGNVSVNYAITLSPVAIVSIIGSGTQPIFVFLIGIIGFVLFPKIFDEAVKEDLFQKIICILFGVAGLIIFYCFIKYFRK